VIGTVDPWTVALAPADWPVLRGDPERRRQHAAADLLVRLGLAERRPDRALALTARAFVPHRAGLEVDWSAAFQECRGEPAALLTLRAVVDGLTALDDPAPITLRELAPRTGYGEKQVRTALHRLVAAGVLETREAPGQPTRYRVTDALLGRGAHAATVQAGPRLVTPAAAGAAPEPVVPARPTSSAPALRLSLNGSTVTLAAGLIASVDLDSDGVPHLHVSVQPRG
jgi:predicted transcriptional regulator